MEFTLTKGTYVIASIQIDLLPTLMGIFEAIKRHLFCFMIESTEIVLILSAQGWKRVAFDFDSGKTQQEQLMITISTESTQIIPRITTELEKAKINYTIFSTFDKIHIFIHISAEEKTKVILNSMK